MTPTTRGLTPAQVHAIQQISHHENLVLLVVFLAAAALLGAGYLLNKVLTGDTTSDIVVPMNDSLTKGNR